MTRTGKSSKANQKSKFIHNQTYQQLIQMTCQKSKCMNLLDPKVNLVVYGFLRSLGAMDY